MIGHATDKSPEEMPSVTRQLEFAVLLTFALCRPCLYADARGTDTLPYMEALSKITPASIPQPLLGIPGSDGWLFFEPELRHLKATAGMTNESPQALAAIIDFNDQLEKAGIRLVVVPVPCKASIYPDKLHPELQKPVMPPFPADSNFCALLRTNGIQVLDLTDAFLKNRDQNSPLYCKTDSHWSPEGIKIATTEISSRVGKILNEPHLSKSPMDVKEETVTFHGDLVSPADPEETVTVRSVSSEGHPIAASRASSVLLLGDSHNLIFHAGGDMHAKGAGLPDQLAVELGFPVDLVAVMGSGATTARWSLARRHDNLSGKKVVVWCFTARDLTEGGRWDKVPVIKPAPTEPQGSPAPSP